jgi:hypothetical protein
MAKTAINGYVKVRAEIEEKTKAGLSWDPQLLEYVPGGRPLKDEFMQLRLELIRKNALRFRPALSSMLHYAPSAQAAEKCRSVIRMYEKTFGSMPFMERLKSAAVRAMAVLEHHRIKRQGIVMRQPPTNRIIYPDRMLEMPANEYSSTIVESANQLELEATAR